MAEQSSKFADILSRYLTVERTIHEPARFGILEVLTVRGETDFNTLGSYLGLTDGNLHGHLNKLEQEKYVEVKKRFLHRKPNTVYRITKQGLTKLGEYLEITTKTLKEMEAELARTRE